MQSYSTDALELHPVDSMSSTEEESPIMAGAGHGLDEEDGLLSAPPEDGQAAKTIDDGPPNAFVWLLTFSAGISGLLFGCEIDVSSFLFYRCFPVTYHLPSAKELG